MLQHEKCVCLVVRGSMGLKRQIKEVVDIRTIHRIKNSPYPQGAAIVEALRRSKKDLSKDDRERIAEIERQRQSLLGRDEPLVDGSLGEGGIYDANKTVHQACTVSKNAKFLHFLFSIVRSLAPKTVLELGTNVGISSAYLAAALMANRTDAKVVTLDSSPYRQRLAKKIHGDVGLTNVDYVQGFFSDTLRPTLDEIGPVDLAFIDGHHQYRPTLDYFDVIVPASTADAVFVFDDIIWSDGMKKAWAELQADPRLGLVVDLKSVGIGVRADDSSRQRYVSPRLRYWGMSL